MSTPVNFSGGYVPPGVYVSTQSTGSTGAVGVGDTVVCLVGTGSGHKVATETITFNAPGASVVLANKGIDPSASALSTTPPTFFVVSAGAAQTLYSSDSTPDGQGGTKPPDYSLTHTAEPLTTDQTTTIKHNIAGSIPIGVPVLVRYNYTDADYYALHSFADFASFSAVYGPALAPDGSISSPLTLAAQIAFQNGANVLYAVAVNTSDTSSTRHLPDQFASAYALTLPNYDINIMVPLFSDAVDPGTAKLQIDNMTAFLNSAASSGFPRIAIVGAAAAFTGDPGTVATQTKYSRIVWIWPQKYSWFNSVLNQPVGIDGFYAAAAAAGFLANNDPNQGLTQASLRSFTGLPTDVLVATSDITKKNTWSYSGVSVFEINRLNQIVCRHGVTTDTTDVGTREISIVRCQDALFVEIELTLLEAELIGTPITDNTTLVVKSLVTGALEAANANDTIASYDSVVVSQQTLPSGDPTVIEVSFNYQPTYPTNYITVTFTLDLSTGNLSTTSSTDTAADASDATLQAAG